MAAKVSIHSIVMTGEGEITVIPNKRLYEKGEKVTIKASPSSNFIGWGHDLSGNESEKEIILEENMLIGANFKENEIKKILNRKIKVINDERMFTLMSFINYTGYDDKNKNSFTKIRSEVRKDLYKMDLNLSNNNYFKEKDISENAYYKALKYIGSAPDFRILNKEMFENGWLSNVSDLDQKLREFYEKANVEMLYKKYQPEYEKAINLYNKEVNTVLNNTVNYLKVDKDELEGINNIAIHINLLEKYQTGLYLSGKDEYLNAEMLMTGPSDYPNLLNIAHEFLHKFINPVTNNLRTEIQQLEYLKEEIPKDSQAQAYINSNGWNSIVVESIIRGLEIKFTDDNVGSEKEYIDYMVNHHGFIMTDYFNERFDEFEEYNGTLEEFIKKLLEEYEEKSKA